MRTDEFDFDLPAHLIAQRPVEPRDTARLLCIGDTLSDRSVLALPDLLRGGDVLVLNDTRVVPTRLRGRRGDARVEVTLHRAIARDTWRAFARPARRLRPGDRIIVAADFTLAVLAKADGGEVTLRLETTACSSLAALHAYGEMPLPPYIRRAAGSPGDDRTAYQTVYAATEGAVAAPTAGLHFTDRLFRALDERGVQRVFLTLHVGAGTFLPIKSEHIDDHRMHAEWGLITREAADRINRARQSGGRIVAVGSTSLRLLESAADDSGLIRPFEGETDIYIRPGYRFRTAEMFLTNFHLPRSTLFVLVAAFAGTSRMKAAYAHAIHHEYRFYSYGDCCLLHRAEAT